LRAVTARICQALFVLCTRYRMQLKRIRLVSFIFSFERVFCLVLLVDWYSLNFYLFLVFCLGFRLALEPWKKPERQTVAVVKPQFRRCEGDMLFSSLLSPGLARIDRLSKALGGKISRGLRCGSGCDTGNCGKGRKACWTNKRRGIRKTREEGRQQNSLMLKEGETEGSKRTGA